jgi:transcriptional regulator with XRE-family HTH domain
MGSRTRTLTGGQGWRMTGVVSGFVLKLARQSSALTQERLAEVLSVDVSTVQGWESGRRPLAAMQAGEFLRLSGRLSRLGAPASTGRHLREAIEADQVLSAGITAGAGSIDAATHPLAVSVHRRTITNLITWPIIEEMPQHLQMFTSTLRRRGPAPSCPVLTAEQRTRFFDHLLTVAERSRGADEALLRRQAVYLLGFDQRPHAIEWLRAEWNRAGRRPVLAGDVTGLLEARSAGVALAASGDVGRLHDFVEHTTDDRDEIANLNYWAHWIGELHDEQTNDAFMLNDDTRSWTGVRLLQHLMNRLQPDAAHLPLNLHTLHALIASRPSLLNGRQNFQATLSGVLDRLASVDDLPRTLREQVAGVQYALRLADR